ncbi:hypothetical protein MKW98_010562 [Papaver atlanticum]|uniref:DUF155 domain-containing protein n=1 Tax=Papaver atlanticum TaxID=357466 RepID=A0AAD4X6M7_9MAGN|nr:hypothetical protein MKW98_010562 [Papaver atlanticum]
MGIRIPETLEIFINVEAFQFNQQAVEEHHCLNAAVNQHIFSSSEVNVGAPNIQKEDSLISIPVRAHFLFNRIDLKRLMADNQANLIPHTSGMINYALLKFGDCDSSSPPQAKPSESSHSYMVVFPYGSTVMFNVLDGEVDRYLKIVEKHASGVLPEMRKDEMSFRKNCIKYEVKENSNLPKWMQGGSGHVMLQHLDNDGIRMISFVLSQRIALDYYVRKLDGVIAAFTELYSERNKMRSYIMRKKRMYRLVGRANSTLAEVMVRLGLFGRLEIASIGDPNYSQMWKYLRDQFEMEQKFVGLDVYLKLIEVFLQFVGTEMTRRWHLTYSIAFLSGYIVIQLSPLGGCSLFSLVGTMNC